MHAEFIAWDPASKEAIWLRRLCNALRIPITSPTVIYTGSANALDSLHKPKYSPKLRWVEIRYWYVKDVVDEGDITLIKCSGKDNAADGLTKALPEVKFKGFIKKLGFKG
jgi:hypothetical protein